MRAYRITGPAQRTELYGTIAAELIAYMRIGQEMRGETGGSDRPDEPQCVSREA